ncbi:hypothetical protein ES319_D05G183800v1 [Gossypium barbadense]|uniref:Uncharacterized protein n=2 Tax=Gossypium TaxID=3633 RepID=A0A5J5RHT3_GOSBA|nr:hypothetical protein ES319_D05G183800v1 [Gossypium barbadense]TYG68956.1 hypothetical protein ES288_D05G193700v1 [Gossypium darwinii]
MASVEVRSTATALPEKETPEVTQVEKPTATEVEEAKTDAPVVVAEESEAPVEVGTKEANADEE